MLKFSSSTTPSYVSTTPSYVIDRANPKTDQPISSFLDTTATERGKPLPERVVREMEILNSMPLGVMVVASDLQLIFRNLKAKEICQEFLQETSNLPKRILEACELFMTDNELYQSDPFVLECYPSQGRKFHIQISWMDQSLLEPLPQQAYMLVVIKDCYEDLMVKTRRAQKRYGLTDREAQIWMMLRLDCSYQEIADRFAISLNTVKTHVKNINVKRRNHPPQSRLWWVEVEDDSDQL
jgi:DNA-binding CsgD family transcriptional regulator